ncbi:hypothetical protein JYU23_01425, partial [bacterium AH-315-C07]|nr:hypothetical protein [bacterium AH-315-C07]
RAIEGFVFFAFLLFFEFMLVLLDPFIEQWTGGEPMWKLVMNAGLAAIIFPLHSELGGYLKRKIIKKKAEDNA